MLFRIPAAGLEGRTLFFASDESPESWSPAAYQQNPLRREGDHLVIEKVVTRPIEFKFVVDDVSKEEAQQLFAARRDARVLVGTRFDYDEAGRSFWLLSPHYDVVRPSEWNQNNFYDPR